MAASDFDFVSTRNDIIRRALSKLGVMAAGEVLSAEQVKEGAESLNTMVSNWAARHLNLWRIESASQAFAAGATEISLSDPLMLGIHQAYYRDADGCDAQLRILSIDEYQEIWKKSETGTPECVCYFPVDRTLKLYPVPEVAGELLGTYILKMADWDVADSENSFPAGWANALIYGLAAELADDYQIPIKERERLDGKAEYYFQVASRLDDDHVARFSRGAYD